MVTVYSKNNCVQCKMTKRFLDSNNAVSYTHLDVYKRQHYSFTPVKIKRNCPKQFLSDFESIYLKFDS